MENHLLSHQKGTPLTLKNILIATACSVFYLLLSAVLIGFKTDQLFLVGLFNVCFYASDRSRRFILGFSVFMVFWIIFDYMKAFPNYWYNTVHIEGLYNAEKSLFGIHSAGASTGLDAVLTPNEYWRVHQSTVLDVLAGCFYICWIPLPLGFAWYLFAKNKEAFFRFALSFLVVNLVGFVVYYSYPAAPPWYVQLHGFDFNPHTPGNVAGLGRWDAFFHVHVFQGLYGKSSNVFAAMPSLHSAYPLTVFFYALRYKMRRMMVVSFVVMIGIWFSAVYTSHHYVMDVLAGICCALVGILLFDFLYARVLWFRALVQRWILGVS